MRGAILLLVLLFAAGPAHAGPIAAAFTAVSGWIAASPILGSLLQLGIGLALSAIQRARIDEPDRPGIAIEQTLVGDTHPDGFVLGRSATAGVFVGPHRTYGKRGEFLVMVIDLGGVPGMTLETVFVNGERAPLRPDAVDPVLGTPIEMEGDVVTRTTMQRVQGPDGEWRLEQTVEQDVFEPSLWVKFLDGTQTAADPHLARFADDPDYPWRADMIGRGRCAAIVTARFVQDRQNRLPQMRFGLRGVPLYDPRRDGSAGGTGPHRWADPATWAPSENPMVQVYNLLRGVPVGGQLYGGGAAAEDLPFDVWAAAMNEADRVVEEDAGDGIVEVPQYRSGLEVLVDREPADAIEAILRTCGGAVTEVGGTWYARCGPAGLPVHHVTDADLVITEPAEFDPFPGLDGTVNAISATHPDPDTAWEMREAPPILRPDLEALDDARHLPETLALDACPYGGQVQRVARAYLADGRRFRTHVLTLPPDARFLRPLDVISWSSDRNGYIDKHFEIGAMAIDPQTYLIQVTLREVDPSDYDWEPGFQLPVAALVPVRSAPSVLGPTLTVYAVIRRDALGRDRAFAIVAEVDEPRARYDLELRVAATGEPAAAQAGTRPVQGALRVEAGLVPATAYELRARYASRRLPGDWSIWHLVTTPDLRLGADDLADGVVDQIIASALGSVEDVKADIIAAIDVDVSDLTGSVSRRVLGLERDLGDAATERLDDLLAAFQARERERDARAVILEDVHEVLEDGRAATARVLDEVAVVRDDALASVRTERESRIAEDGAISARLTTEVAAARADAQALVTQESVARVTATEALGQQIVQVDARLEDAETGVAGLASGVQTLTARVTTTEGQIQSVSQAATVLTSRVDDPQTGLVATADATELLETRVTSTEGSVSAQSQRIDTLEAQVADPGSGLLARAAVLETDIVRVETGPDGTIALAGRVSNVEASVADAQARVSTLEGTRVTASGAVAAVQQQISAEFGSLTAMAEATAFAESTANRVVAGYLFEATGGGSTATMRLVAGDGGGLPFSKFRVDANQIELNGSVLINGTTLREKIAQGAVTRLAVAGDSATTNNSSSFTTVCTATLPGDTDGADVIVNGLTYLGSSLSSYPSGFLIRVQVAGNTVQEYNKAALDFLGGSRQVPLIGARLNDQTAGTIAVTVQIRNAGGHGLFSTQIHAQAAYR
jgi:uncharacterized coiled-coil protein SlyX